MGISKYNSKGYHVPTTYKTLTNIIKDEKAEENSAFKPLVYICLNMEYLKEETR